MGGNVRRGRAAVAVAIGVMRLLRGDEKCNWGVRRAQEFNADEERAGI
jgi:hypothetical protein